VVSGLDLDGAVAAGGPDELRRSDQPHSAGRRHHELGKIIAGAVSAVVASTARPGTTSHGAAVAAKLFPDVLLYTIGTPAVFGFNEMNGAR
jgi:hypothetical protein